MTLREAVHAVHAMTYDQTVQAEKKSTRDIMLRKVAHWRLTEPVAWREIRDHVYGGPQVTRRLGTRDYQIASRPRATIREVRERAAREQGAA